MSYLALFLLLAQSYTVEGRVEPEGAASVTLHGATFAFERSTMSDSRGAFQFKSIDAGSYTLSAFLPGFGETSQTVVVGPGTVDNKGRLRVTVAVRDGGLRRDYGTVSVRQLKIPNKARGEYRKAQSRLSKGDVEGAVEAMEKAVEIAPQFAEVWNHLGTISYHAQEYRQAEERFRTALKADPNQYAALVNLGGTLLHIDGGLEEAHKLNQHAILLRPNDPLAHAQLGLALYMMSRREQAEKHLKEAKRLDPAHFSHPQKTLFRIYVDTGRLSDAAAELEDFTRRHPDAPETPKMLEAIKTIRAQL